MSDTFDYSVVEDALARCGAKQSSIIAILQTIQEHFHYLPEEIFPYLADKLDMSEARIYSVATFYENFSLEKKGKYVIKICDGTACHVRGASPVMDAFRQALGLTGKKSTTDDMLFSLEIVSCLGACGLAPTAMVNEDVYPKMTPEKAAALVKELREKEA